MPRLALRCTVLRGHPTPQKPDSCYAKSDSGGRSGGYACACPAGKYAQVTNNPEMDGCIKCVVRASLKSSPAAVSPDRTMHVTMDDIPAGSTFFVWGGWRVYCILAHVWTLFCAQLCVACVKNPPPRGWSWVEVGLLLSMCCGISVVRAWQLWRRWYEGGG